jgi:hypothetical protein
LENNKYLLTLISIGDETRRGKEESSEELTAAQGEEKRYLKSQIMSYISTTAASIRAGLATARGQQWEAGSIGV